MNVAKAAAYLLLPLLVTVMVPGQVWGQSGAPGTKLRRVVLRDTETIVASASQYRIREGEGYEQCTPNGIPNSSHRPSTARCDLSSPISESRKGRGA